MKKNKQNQLIAGIIVLLLLLFSMCLAAMMSKYNDSVDPEDYDTDPPAINEEDINDDVDPTSTVTPTEVEKPKYLNEALGLSVEEMEGWVISEEFPEPIKTRLANNSDFLPPCELAIYSSNGNTVLLLDISTESDGPHCFSANEVWEGYKLTFSPFQNLEVFSSAAVLQKVENAEEMRLLTLIVGTIEEY